MSPKHLVPAIGKRSKKDENMFEGHGDSRRNAREPADNWSIETDDDHDGLCPTEYSHSRSHSEKNKHRKNARFDERRLFQKFPGALLKYSLIKRVIPQ